MAIAMAQHGGLGVVHHNCSIEVQAHEVQLVKKYRNGVILDPIILTPEHTVSDCLKYKKEYGFAGFPITENGKLGEKLLGIVASRDIDLVEDPTTKIKDVMTSENIQTVSDKMDSAEAVELLRKSKVGKLPVVDSDGNIVALMSRTDLIKNRDFPMATTDSQGRLVCAASVGTRPIDKDRAKALIEAGVDGIRIGMGVGSIILRLMWWVVMW